MTWYLVPHDDPGLSVLLVPLNHLEVVPDELTPGMRTGVGQEGGGHHGVGGLGGGHGVLPLLGDLAVVGPRVDAVDNNVMTI